MKPGLISAVILGVVLGLTVCFASSLEPTAPGMILLVLVPVLLLAGLGVSAEKRSWFFACILAGCCGYAAWASCEAPIRDYGRSDLLLVACGLSGALWAGWLASPRMHRWVAAGMAVVAMANLVVALVQLRDPSFTPFYGGRQTASFPSGFYGHYNHFANFMLAAGFLAAGCALTAGEARLRRVVWILVAAGCAAGIALSRSRGAFLGMGAGTGVLLVCWLLDLKRRRVKWTGLALIGLIAAIPMLGFGGWWAAKRFLGDRIAGVGSGMIHDSGRLNYASVAVEIANDQPLTGGGSRSFSYEIFKRWDPVQLWTGSGDIDFVHNEILQTATDYGWIGVGLVVGFMAMVGIRALVVLAVEPESGERGPDGGLTAGAIAAMAAVGMQSMFSFVFHMAPDVLVFGLLIGFIVAQPWPFSKIREHGRAWVRPGAWSAVGLSVILVAVGWRDAAAWWISARPGSEGFSRNLDTRYNAWQRAAEIRPDSRLDHNAAETAGLLWRSDLEEEGDEWGHRTFMHLQRAVERNPQNHADRLNMARLMDHFERFTSAEQEYRKLIPMMDVREMYYRTRFSYGDHAFRRAYALFQARRAPEALAWALEAKKQMLLSKTLCWYSPESEQESILKRVEEFIRTLEEARYSPEPDVVPPIADIEKTDKPR